jgi:hypothetical protein
MEKARATSEKLILASKEMESVINSLQEEALGLISVMEKFKV